MNLRMCLHTTRVIKGFGKLVLVKEHSFDQDNEELSFTVISGNQLLRVETFQPPAENINILFTIGQCGCSMEIHQIVPF